MKFLADENVSDSIIRNLRKQGYDVKDIKKENLIGISDKEILKIAIKEERIVITHDKDFSNILNNPKQRHFGIILIRLSDQSPENVTKRLLPALKRLKGKIKGSLLIITDKYAWVIRSTKK